MPPPFSPSCPTCRLIFPFSPVLCSDITRVNVMHKDHGPSPISTLSSPPTSLPSSSDDTLINWTKFEAFGELLHAMQTYQRRGCKVKASSGSNVVAAMMRDKPPIASDSVSYLLDPKKKQKRKEDGGMLEKFPNPASNHPCFFLSLFSLLSFFALYTDDKTRFLTLLSTPIHLCVRHGRLCTCIRTGPELEQILAARSRSLENTDTDGQSNLTSAFRKLIARAS